MVGTFLYQPLGYNFYHSLMFDVVVYLILHRLFSRQYISNLTSFAIVLTNFCYMLVSQGSIM
jgi:hypothetical protein